MLHASAVLTNAIAADSRLTRYRPSAGDRRFAEALQRGFNDLDFAYDGAYRQRGSLSLAQQSAFGLVRSPKPYRRTCRPGREDARKNDKLAAPACATLRPGEARLSELMPSRGLFARAASQHQSPNAPPCHELRRKSLPLGRNHETSAGSNHQRVPRAIFSIRCGATIARCVVVGGRAYVGIVAWTL